jgi:hypothetical protein
MELKMDKLRKIIKFEQMNPDYPEHQAEGLVFEVDKAVKTNFIDDRYMQEKVDNIIRFYTSVLGNFKDRMMHNPELRKEFIEFLEKN